MRYRRTVTTLGVLAVAAFLIALSAYFLIRKNCCEQLDDSEIRSLEVAARAGDVSAMKRLYVFFEESGRPGEAEAWLKRAADTGDAEAEFDLWDRSVGAQREAALKYLRRSAEHGSSFAQLTLGKLYEDGIDVSKDIETAKYWFRRSASVGEPSAVLALCDLAVTSAMCSNVESASIWRSARLTS